VERAQAKLTLRESNAPPPSSRSTRLGRVRLPLDRKSTLEDGKKGAQLGKRSQQDDPIQPMTLLFAHRLTLAPLAPQKPASGKARKEQLQLKRARKRAAPSTDAGSGEATGSTLASTGRSSSSLTGTGSSKSRIGQRFRTAEQRARDDVHAGRMKLESRFIRLSKDRADENRLRAANERLHRPIDPSLAVLHEEDLVPPKRTAAELLVAGEKDASVDELTCPKRPKWKYTMTKAEVEKNEGTLPSYIVSFFVKRRSLTHCVCTRSEGVFRNWLAATDALIARDTDASPTFFERNLNVWRQLWRTTETSDILLVLIGMRCFPSPSTHHA
jgi:hypothetical protein